MTFCVCINDPGSPLAKLDEYFKIKEGSIQVSTFYLGAKLKKTVLPNGVVAWDMSSRNYVQSTVQNVEEYLAALVKLLPLPQPPLRPRTDARTNPSPREPPN
jgi:hypothetical protein